MKKNRGSRGLGAGGNEELLFSGCRVSVWNDERYMEVDSGGWLHSIVNILNAAESHI